jgi:hypothetical protein
VFAWCLAEHADAVRAAMVLEFSRHQLQADHWITAIEPAGARVIG